MYYKGTLEGESKSYIILFNTSSRKEQFSIAFLQHTLKEKSVEIGFLFIHIQKVII